MMILLRFALLALLAAGAACHDDTCMGACHYANGASCALGCQCASGKCVDGACAEPSTAATECTGNASCGAGTCALDLGICSGATCQTAADCPRDEECEAGSCVVRLCI